MNQFVYFVQPISRHANYEDARAAAAWCNKKLNDANDTHDRREAERLIASTTSADMLEIVKIDESGWLDE